MFDKLLLPIIAMMVGIVFLFAVFPTILSSTNTSVNGSLGAADAQTKTIINLIPFLVAVAGLALVAGGIGGFFYVLKKGIS